MARILKVCLAVMLLAFTAASTGCALGVTKIPVGHNDLTPVAAKRTGTIYVQTFVDNRPADNQEHQYIGYKRNGYGMTIGRIGALDDRPVNVTVTNLFVDALKHTGYNVVSDTPGATTQPRNTVAISGAIDDFWIDMYMQVWFKMKVHIKLVDKAGQTVWEKDMAGGANNVLWWGAPGEFQGTMDQGVTDVLNIAVKEFSSQEFCQKVADANK